MGSVTFQGRAACTLHSAVVLTLFEHFFRVNQTRRVFRTAIPACARQNLCGENQKQPTRMIPAPSYEMRPKSVSQYKKKRNRLPRALSLAFCHRTFKLTSKLCVPVLSTPLRTRGYLLPRPPWWLVVTNRDADAPTLPADGPWSSEFREFLSLCLEKNPARRMGCSALMETAFIQGAAATWQPGMPRCVPHDKEERKTRWEEGRNVGIPLPFSLAPLPGAPLCSYGGLRLWYTSHTE